jgi:hypothetical protein
MEAGAASAGGIGGAKTRERTGNQNQSEKRLHVLSVHFLPHRGSEPSSRMIRRVDFCNMPNIVCKAGDGLNMK